MEVEDILAESKEFSKLLYDCLVKQSALEAVLISKGIVSAQEIDLARIAVMEKIAKMVSSSEENVKE